MYSASLLAVSSYLVAENLISDLVAGSDPRTPGNHVELFDVMLLIVDFEIATGKILELPDRTTHIDGARELHISEVLAHFSSTRKALARWVGLDDKLHNSYVKIRGDWSVSPHGEASALTS